MEKKLCILYDNKICDNCGECNMCDLDPKKVCDSCGACLEMDDEYSTIDVDLTFEDADEPEMLSYEEMFPEKAFIGENGQDDEEEDYDYADEDDDFGGFDDFDDSDGFYEDESLEDDEDDSEGLRRDFGELF